MGRELERQVTPTTTEKGEQRYRHALAWALGDVPNLAKKLITVLSMGAEDGKKLYRIELSPRG
ncbi:MAG: hypothetical protein HYV63_12395 [Candidatus Schekmanbacteria bacterium]|nr:hypothetical protein [Candidatus Schekmanbacteria bacterium]